MMLYELHPAVVSLVESSVTVLLTAGTVHALRALGRPGETVREWLTRAPGLDVIVAWLTLGPPVAAAAVCIFKGRSAGMVALCMAAAVAGQVAALYLWCWGHELMRGRPKGGRLVDSINRRLGGPIAGRVCNHLGLLWMLLAVPVFNIVRLAEYVVYPVLVVLTRLPRYRHAEWVNISRHKVDGLVGHDLIWCLYCDWMTGVWSLGTEMLRNIESFWCPIRFSSPHKCANCRIDFPDVDGGWSGEHAGVAGAASVIDRLYPAPDGSNAWLGHPVRLTVNGRHDGQPITHGKQASSRSVEQTRGAFAAEQGEA